jgi:hypothetical protein
MYFDDLRKTAIGRITPMLAVFSLLVTLFAFAPGAVLAQEDEDQETAQQRQELGNAPMFWIVEVVQNESVTIETANMPSNQNFTVRMGEMGTLGIGGAEVATTHSGDGGVFRETFSIPEHLHTNERISIRLDGHLGAFAFNWFYNRDWREGDPTGIGAVQPGTTEVQQVVIEPAEADPAAVGVAPEDAERARTVPRFWIVEVVQNESVTIETANMPANQNFTVRMGPMGTLAIGGTEVGVTHSGDGGVFRETYSIPEHLHTSERISIRLDSAPGAFAFNWFYNRDWSEGDPVGIGAVPPRTFVSDDLVLDVTDPVAVGPAPAPAEEEEAADPGVVPSIRIVEVVQNESVTIETANFPPNQQFTVRMGEMGTEGIGGTVVDTTDSGDGGVFQATYEIPEEFHTQDQIAIRLESPEGFFAFGWFFNRDSSE